MSSTREMLLALAAGGLWITPALAQDAGDCPPTVAAPPGAERAFEGVVELSGDGTVAVTAGKGAEGAALYTWRRGDRGEWQETPLLTANSRTFAVGGAGNTLAVGVGDKAGNGTQIFRFGDDGRWHEQVRLTAQLSAAPPTGIAVGADGQLTTVAPSRELGGAVVQQFTPTADGYAAGAPFSLVGRTLQAMGADAGQVALGLTDADGSRQVVVLDGGDDGWIETGRLTAADSSSNDQFGSAVAMRGSTVAVGSPGAQAAHVFAKTGEGGWREVTRLTAEEAYRAGDPDTEWAFTALLTARDSLRDSLGDDIWALEPILTARDTIRDVTVFERQGFWNTTELADAAKRLDGVIAAAQREGVDPTWLEAQVLTAKDLVQRSVSSGSGTAYFGQSVSMSGDGTTILVGANGNGRSFKYVWRRGGDGAYAPAVILTADGDTAASVARPSGALDTGSTVALAGPRAGFALYEQAELCAAPVDRDGDGIEDASDACPDKPAGEYDFDGDGCPDNREGMAAGLAAQAQAAFAGLAEAGAGSMMARARIGAAEREMLGPQARGGAIAAFRRGQTHQGVNLTATAAVLLDIRDVDTADATSTILGIATAFVQLDLDEAAAAGLDPARVASAQADVDAAIEAFAAGDTRPGIRFLLNAGRKSN